MFKIASRPALPPIRALRTIRAWLALAIACAAMASAGQAAAQAATPALSRLETIGQRLFNDRNLSEPAGVSCASCHTAATGFANNNGSRIGVPLGSLPTSFGLRNAMANAYSTFVPAFRFRTAGNGAIEAQGGHFWDGRADTLAQQALGPLLNALEMNNANAAAVVKKVAASNYADLFRAEFGATIFNSPDTAFLRIGDAIAAFEGTATFQQFTSKFDAFVRNQVQLSAAETRGMNLFRDRNKGNCIACHRMNPASGDPRDSLFTDFTFHALGVPRNTAIPQNANAAFFDLGLCGPARTRPALGANVPANVSIEQYCGTFRMVSLRNVAQRQAFMHNGFFKDLREVVSFYATRNSNPQRWYGAAGVPNDLPVAYQGNIINDRPPFNRPRNAGPALTEAEIDDVVSFLHTLTDGFTAPAAPTPAVTANPANPPVTRNPPPPPPPPAVPPQIVARSPF